MIWSWFQRAYLLLCFIICLVLLILESKKILQQSNGSKSTTGIKIYAKLMDIWCILTILSCCIHLLTFLLYTFPPICLFVIDSFFLSTYTLVKVFFTFFSISRLQYCLHALYPKWIFPAFYTNGILMLILFQIFQSTQMDANINHQHSICYLLINDCQRVYIMSCMLWYYCWDILVLVMYIKKSYFLFNIPNKKEYQKASLLIVQVLILSIINESVSIIFTILPGLFIPSNTNNVIYHMLSTNQIEVVMSSILITLMTRRHYSLYRNIITCSGCCLHKLVGQYSEKEKQYQNIDLHKVENNINPINVMSMSIDDNTKTPSNVPKLRRVDDQTQIVETNENERTNVTDDIM